MRNQLLAVCGANEKVDDEMDADEDDDDADFSTDAYWIIPCDDIIPIVPNIRDAIADWTGCSGNKLSSNMYQDPLQKLAAPQPIKTLRNTELIGCGPNGGGVGAGEDVFGTCVDVVLLETDELILVPAVPWFDLTRTFCRWFLNRR